MPYYLKHHFNPEFDYTNLKPREVEGGSVDYYNMGYVQNVEPGQVLAEWVDDPLEAEEYGATVYEEKEFPAGRNTRIDPSNPDRLIADAYGYVFYEEGKICIKKTLNVRRDVDFHTGNISFVGDVVVHGDIKSGFQVQGHNVMTKGTIDAASVRAKHSFVSTSGIKGGGKAVVRSGGSMRVAFVEKAMLLAGGRMLIDGACMHSNIYAGDQLAVKGRLAGGCAVCSRLVYVGETLGGGMNAETVIILGYNAVLMNKSHLVEAKIKELRNSIEEQRRLLLKDNISSEGIRSIIAKDEEKLALYKRRHDEIWSQMRALEDLETCKVVVPGKVRPGVEICIGEASLVVDEYLEDVCFTYKDHEIVVSSPAMKR